MNDDVASEVREIVDRETRAWDTKDAELLLSVFHPDMVWPWPKSPSSHDPMEWTLQWGRYDRRRWLDGWQELFDTHQLVRNVRETKKVEVSEQGDGAFAVVDIDTLWRDLEGEEMRWKGEGVQSVLEGWPGVEDDHAHRRAGVPLREASNF